MSLARAINDNGKIVGSSALGSIGINAFIYENGTMTALEALAGQASEAWDINNNDYVVGNFLDNSSQSSAGLWIPENGTYSLFSLQSLISVTDQSMWDLELAVGINDLNQIVGTGYLVNNGQRGERRAFLLTANDVGDPSDGIVPEPATVLLFAGGLAAAIYRRK